MPGKLIEAIACGSRHVLLLSRDKQVFSFGYNGYGALGDGTLSQRSAPVKLVDKNNIITQKSITAIAAGNYHSVLLASDGIVYT
jgi:alpha-tubulin suppressor-like RCC1 family protein